MSAPMPAAWDPEADQTESHQPKPCTGVWVLRLNVSVATSITQVDLPYWDRANPVLGAKEARDSMRKLMTGMNNDVNPLNFRSEYLRDSHLRDPYYPYAPGWTTLSGGSSPMVTCTPTQIATWAIDAMNCVPFIKEAAIIILELDGTQTPVTLDELKMRNIQIKRVPRLLTVPGSSLKKASANNNDAGSNSQADTLRAQLNVQTNHVSTLEAQIKELKEMLAAKAAAEPVAAPAAAPEAAQEEATESNQRSKRARQ